MNVPPYHFRSTLIFALGAGWLFYVASSAPRLFSNIDHPLWRNIYLWALPATNPYAIGFGVFLIIACLFNAGAAWPRRVWRASLILLSLLACLFLLAGCIARLLPRVGLLDSLQVAFVGLGVGLLLVDGTPQRVLQALATRGTDYAGRFFPLTGFVICLLFLGPWGPWLCSHWPAHDLTATLDRTCFMLGMICVMLAGRREDMALPTAAPVEV